GFDRELIRFCRSVADKTPPALAFIWSTNAVADMPFGNTAVNSGRCTNANAKACLFASSCACQLPTLTITPCPLCCVSLRNGTDFSGRGAPCRLQKLLLYILYTSYPVSLNSIDTKNAADALIRNTSMQ